MGQMQPADANEQCVAYDFFKRHAVLSNCDLCLAVLEYLRTNKFIKLTICIDMTIDIAKGKHQYIELLSNSTARFLEFGRDHM